MSKHHSGKEKCPHCGRGGGFPLHLAVSAVILAASALLWRDSRLNKAADAPQDAGSSAAGLSPQRAAYLLSPEGAGACAPCLAAADKFIASKRAAALAAKVKGMALVPAGEYQVGSPEGIGDPDEHPRHAVALDAFYMDAREVTVSDYMKMAEEGFCDYPEWAKPDSKFNIKTGSSPHYSLAADILASCPDCPVMGVTHKDAAAYCARAGKRLPTEAEWEAAARAGKGTAFSYGDSEAAIGEYAWYEGNSGGRPHPVGAKKPNAFGLYDMHGNVWEWTADFYEKKYYSAGPARSPAGPEKGRERVLRGGSWAFDPDSLRSGNRASSDKANDDIGFRCAASRADMERLAQAETLP